MQILELAIQCWNIYGIFTNINGFGYSKLDNPLFSEHIKNHQIFGLVETHHTSDDIDRIQILGYKCFQTCRKKLKFGRKHGGLAIYVHNSILAGVSKIATTGSETIQLKLNKDFFSLDKDIVASFSYCSPANSSYTQRTQLDTYDDLEQKLGILGHEFDLICLGDYNARTGTKLDYITDEDNSDMPELYDYHMDSVATYPRGNLDQGTNSYGDTLLTLCKSVPLRICNGRKIGDILGSHTCYKWNGKSTVDYCLVSPRIYNKVMSFHVNKFLPTLSDHCSISVRLRTNFTCNSFQNNPYDFIEKPRKIIWDKEIAQKFENILQLPESKNFISNFAKNGISNEQNGIDSATCFLSDFLTNSAELAGNNENRIEFKCPQRSSKPNWKFTKKKSRKKYHPKWHDATFESVLKKIHQSAYLLKKYPNNQYLKSQLLAESKQYKKLLKSKQKTYLNKLFMDLDSMKDNNPRGYMNLVKSLRSGSFDKKVSDDSSFVSAEKWHSHFVDLLGPPVTSCKDDETMTSFIETNRDNFSTELDLKFTRVELLSGISSLDNNKSSSFDRISNEMLKTGKLILAEPILLLFNAILKHSIYPNAWSCDILTPLHKKGEKSDPNNFRGISVSSCLGKLFNKLLQRRMEKHCNHHKIINEIQGSGKARSRTSDHLLILRFLIDKYVNSKGKKLFACFVDLQKAYDTVPRIKLFYSLLKDYSIGGNFLKILQKIYENNQVYVKLTDGLLQPFTTSIGVKQGCVFSPLLFNIFINKISNIFDESCAPVKVNNIDVNCLLWADDLLLVSETATGLQNSVNKMGVFYDSLDLKVNLKKTQIIIFNKRGLKMDKCFNFSLKGRKLEIVDQYQYLGLKLRPSGSMGVAVQELHDKANRAWFGISNVIYKHKRMDVDKIFSIFDSLVTPVALYGCEFWLPLVMPKNCYKSKSNLLEYWEKFACEKINQKCARVALSVNRKTSRLAVLGELGRYPLLINALAQCLNYKTSLLGPQKPDSLVTSAVQEMQAMASNGEDCWLTRVNQIQTLLNVPNTIHIKKGSGKRTKSFLKSKFDRFWLDKINEYKTYNVHDQADHNKLRTYKTFKSSLSREPYLDLVRNRNQRAFLSRLRTGSHTLGIEKGRWTKPVTPLDQRICVYCSDATATTTPTSPRPPPVAPPPGSVDNEHHFLIQCSRFANERIAVFAEMSSLMPDFMQMSDQHKFKILLCPTSPQAAKLTNRFIKLMFECRAKIENSQAVTNCP